MLIASDFEGICPSEVQVFVYITADTYTRTSLLIGKLDTCRPGTPHLDVHGCPFLEACWMNGPMRCTTAEPHSVPVRACYHRLFCERTLAITSCVIGNDSVPHCSPVARVPSSRRAPELEPRWFSYNYMGQTETPRREVWSVSFFSKHYFATAHINM